ncbi:MULTISPECIES: fumarylacetoacetate hydrolase family protein [Paracoccus]|jgi:2-keto-4-pentenoate hydratase|uniref:Hydratase n=2 Tax=Paracoccus litorisediminis TaxID=2006130 RepID=A0A844HM72_9RHOB|nr:MULTISPECIES: fumarylacetoacetate hydrolase family protein [Paracoccus]MBD9526349.1 hydratase [Paracoccus sp. PAR01]MTH58752.1 hydratase [Paracoccus litorisediminis]
MKALILGAVMGCCVTAADAACPDVSLMQNAARGWIAGQRLPDPVVRNMDDANCAYTSFRSVLEAELGPPVGVKVGFTSQDVRDRFGVEEPISGALFGPMLLPNGSRLSLRGSRMPHYEADLVVTVGDPAIMHATTREEVAAALRDVRPFIELPDIAFSRGTVPTGPIMAAYGGAPWRGVLGDSIAISELENPVEDLGKLGVSLKNNGQTVAISRGDRLLGHPLDVVLWLVQQGHYDLKAGSIISLGAFAAFAPAVAGHRIEAEYNLAGRTMRASVTLIP